MHFKLNIQQQSIVFLKFDNERDTSLREIITDFVKVHTEL